MRQLICCCAIVLSASNCSRTPVVGLSVGVAPTPLLSGGLTRLAYELHVALPADSPAPLRITSLDVLADDRTQPLATIAGDPLVAAIAHPGSQARGAGPTDVAPGQIAVIRVWVTLPDKTVPAGLRHRLAGVRDQETIDVSGGAVTVRSQPAVFALPLRDGRWLALEGPGNPRSHHWAPLETNGRVRVPQRFALDLIGLDAAGRAVRDGGAPSRNEDWAGYGIEVIAVADGVIRDAQDNRPDSPALAALPKIESPSLQAVAGNYVIQDLGEGRLVLYAHLQPRSVAVRPGQQVRRGQVLGRVGSSGNSNAPHLHFQVFDSVDLEAAEGLPYVFESFDHFGEASAERAILGPPAPLPPAGSKRLQELPLDGAVVGFPGPGKPF